ncbi:PDDEXK nuclease domain-containing protein [Cupriavidus sp. 2TAF22]|uniref:PDDEXK nuclease domain-containing protein n=1 Tax=unclassified Cupriavidus TaxID=2640874 RepID=UPI003F8FB7DA
MTRKRVTTQVPEVVVPQGPVVNADALAGDIRRLISEARAGLAVTVNATLTMLYWRVGQRIRSEVLGGERAEYGEQIVVSLSRQLEAEHGRGFSAKNLRHMLRLAEAFPCEDIVYALSRQLSWTHLRSLIYIDDPLKREFYLEMCRNEGWSTRTLQDRLDSMLFERTALSRKSDELLAAADKGQMELYLRWLAKHEQEPGEAPPLGIILCSGKKREHIELLELDQTGIHVAEYLTELPPRQLLEQKLHEAVALSKARLANRADDTGDELEADAH